MPINGFKPGDHAETPGRHVVTIIGVKGLDARVRYEDGHTRMFRQAALRLLDLNAENYCHEAPAWSNNPADNV